jgi:hypothetical protein
MIVRKKKRDVKFIIYQSLYILVISSLAMNHMTLSNLAEYVKPSANDTIVKKPSNGEKYEIVNSSDTIINTEVISDLRNKIDSLEKVKTGIVIIDNTKKLPPVIQQPKTDPPVVPKIKGGEKRTN